MQFFYFIAAIVILSGFITTLIEKPPVLSTRVRISDKEVGVLIGKTNDGRVIVESETTKKRHILMSMDARPINEPDTLQQLTKLAPQPELLD